MTGSTEIIHTAQAPQTLPDGFGEVNGITPVYGVPGEQSFTGADEDIIELAHTGELLLAEGTYAMTFNATDIVGEHALFSKDANGNRDGGHLTAYIYDGVLKIRMQSEDSNAWVKLYDDTIQAGVDYHLAISFGDGGLQVYLNGELAGTAGDFNQGMELNTENIVLGGNGWGRHENGTAVQDEFAGTITDFTVYGKALDHVEMATITGNDDVLYMLALEDLMPAFAQLHQASDELLDIAEGFGYSHDGDMMMEIKDIIVGTNGNDLIEGVDDTIEGADNTDYLNGDMGNDTLNGNAGDDELQGAYGNDNLNGGAGNDLMDGGHGEDILNGGAGDDFLISRADGREGFIAYDPARDEGDPYNELDPATGKLYSDQPIPADDVLTGGSGADTFYFQTLINTKARYLDKHTQSDGTIRWHGVAGENDKLHDHWVDVIGDDTITDFNRAEGDKIIIEGHTTEVLDVTHHDSNGDNIMDYSVIQLYSNQGNNGGAHANDLLGTITVHGNLLRENDFSEDAGPAYGIIKNIYDRDEAITPLDNGTERLGAIDIPEPEDTTDFGVVNGIAPIFGVPGVQEFSGEDEDYYDFANSHDLMLAEGTYAMGFNAGVTSGVHTLFSKDANGNREGGHLTAMIYDGVLKIRMQSEDCDKWIKLSDNPIQAGTDYHLAITFGEAGLKVYLNGQLMGAEPEFKETMEMNYENIVLGANGWARNDNGDNAKEEFIGSITDFAVYEQALGNIDIATLSGDPDALYALNLEDLMPAFAQFDNNPTDELIELAAQFGYNEDGSVTVKDITVGTDAADLMVGDDDADFLNGGMGNDTLDGGLGNDELQGSIGNDDLIGDDGDDLMDGGLGEDILDGGAGNDVLISRADAGEPFVAYDPFRDEEDPLFELDPVTGKLYPNQPLHADDILTGGAGADLFYFQTVINAKERYIEEHTRDDGSINWNRVAGENDKIHDHWVDSIGNDTITDFDRAEGDQIRIEGHTTQLLELTHGDSDNDGIMDHSVINLYSNQGGGGGAHNKDLLGTITVLGTLITEDDFTTEGANYGIVNTIDSIDEAINLYDGTDRGVTPDNTFITPADFGVVNGNTPIFGVAGVQEFSGEDGSYLDLGHHSQLELSEGTYAMNFNVDSTSGNHALFSKDAKDYGLGGHFTAMIYGNTLKVRLQSDAGERWLKLYDNPIEANTDYHLAVTFGSAGLQVFLNGVLMAENTEWTQGMATNTESIVFGGNSMNRGNQGDGIRDEFDGMITNFAVYGNQLSAEDILLLASNSIDDEETVIEEPDEEEEEIIEEIVEEEATEVEPDEEEGSSTSSGGGGGSGGGNKGGSSSNKGGVDRSSESDDDHDNGFGNDGRDVGNDKDINDMNGRTNPHSTENITGTEKHDFVEADEGDDTVIGGAGDDTIKGGDGADKLMGDEGDDWFNGNRGNDIIRGGTGNDVVRGGKNQDNLSGGGDQDFVNGNIGNDTITGDSGNDTLHGGKNNDIIFGGTGDDTIFGDLGNDRLAGNDGADRFVFNALTSGNDIITDFVSGSDVIELRNSGFDSGAKAAAAFSNGILDLGGGNMITLTGITSLTADDFVL